MVRYGHRVTARDGPTSASLEGWCYEEEGAPPYLPWVQPIRAYVQQAGAEQLTAEMGSGSANRTEAASYATRNGLV